MRRLLFALMLFMSQSLQNQVNGTLLISEFCPSFCKMEYLGHDCYQIHVPIL